MFKLILRL